MYITTPHHHHHDPPRYSFRSRPFRLHRVLHSSVCLRGLQQPAAVIASPCRGSSTMRPHMWRTRGATSGALPTGSLVAAHDTTRGITGRQHRLGNQNRRLHQPSMPTTRLTAARLRTGAQSTKLRRGQRSVRLPNSRKHGLITAVLGTTF